MRGVAAAAPAAPAALAALTALLLGPASAGAYPSSEAGAVENVTTGTPVGIAVSADGRYVAMVEASGGGLGVVDRNAVSEGATSVSVCTGAASIAYVDDAVAGERFFVGCASGVVHAVDVDESTVPTTFAVSDEILLNEGSGDVDFLVHAPGDSQVFAIVQDGGNFTGWSVSVAAAGTGDGETASLGNVFGTLTIIAAAIGESGTPLVLARSDGYLNLYSRAADAFATGTGFPDFALGTLSDVAVRSSVNQILVADQSGDELWTYPLTGGSIGASWGGGFESPEVVVYADDPVEGELAWVAEAGNTVYAIDQLEAEVVAIDLGGASPVGVGAADGLDEVFVAGSDRSLRILSDLPFLGTVSASPTSVGEGEDFTLSFTVNSDVSWGVEIGGDGTSGSGTVVDSGDADDGDTVSLTINADALSDEGGNRIHVFVTDTVGTGVDSVIVTLDTPPDAPGDPTAAAGENRLTVSWDATDEADIASYELYLSDAEFTEDALPAFEVVRDDGGVDTYPVTVTAGEPSTEQSYTVEGLTNGTTYWVAVRAIDESDQIGPLSAVTSGVPRETCGAAECANDPGCSCSSISPRAAGAPALLLGVLATFRRRRRG